MKLKPLTDYDNMLLGIMKRSSKNSLPKKKEDVAELQPLFRSPTILESSHLDAVLSGESIEEETLREYIAYLNTITKRGVPF